MLFSLCPLSIISKDNLSSTNKSRLTLCNADKSTLCIATTVRHVWILSNLTVNQTAFDLQALPLLHFYRYIHFYWSHLREATQNITMNTDTSPEPTQTDIGGDVFRQMIPDFTEISVLTVTCWCVATGQDVAIRHQPWMTELSRYMQTAHNMTMGSDCYCCRTALNVEHKWSKEYHSH